MKYQQYEANQQEQRSVNFEIYFWSFQFSPKKERKQDNLRYHSGKVEFICLFFGGNVGLKKIISTLSDLYKKPQIVICPAYWSKSAKLLPKLFNLHQIVGVFGPKLGHRFFPLCFHKEIRLCRNQSMNPKRFWPHFDIVY